MSDLSFEDLLPTTAELQPTHPTLGKLPVRIRLRSTLSSEYTLKQLEYMHAINRLQKAEKKEDYARVAKDLEAFTVDTAAWAIVGWDNDKLMGTAYSPEAAKRLMADPRFTWLRKEVNEYVQQDAHFFRQPEGAAEGAGGEAGEEEQPAGKRDGR